MTGTGYHYRITVDLLEEPHRQPGEEGDLQSISFFASTPHDMVVTANRLRDRFACSASHATKLAVGVSLISEVMQAHRDPIQLHNSLLEFLRSLEPTAARADA